VKSVVKLTGNDGDAYAVLSACQKAARKADMPTSTLQEFLDEAMSGDYDHLLQTTFKYFEVE
jgi:hypothetical protein